MNLHNTRKQSPNLAENRSKKIRTIENPILTKRKNNYDNRSNLYRFNETKNKIIQQLSELFIPKDDLTNFLSLISKFSIDNSNFLQIWNNFADSITNYLDDSIASRCSIYINEQIDECRNQINEVYNRLNSDHKQINKKNSMIYKNIQCDLDNLYSNLNQPGNGKIKIISESSSLFDQFNNSLRSNYLPFFQCVSNDQKTMNIFLKSAIKPICNIINCVDSILNLEEIQKKFFTQLNHSTATFVKIYNTQYPPTKKMQKNSQIPVLSNSLKLDHSTKQANSTSKIPKSKKRSSSLSSPLSQKPLGRYNSNHAQNKNDGSNIKPLRHRKSETSIISLPDFSQKKFLPRSNKTNKNDTNNQSKKSSKSDNEDDQKNSLDTHMHSDDMYAISNGKLSESGDETTNVPIKPKPFKISQTRYDQLNKKYSNSPTKINNNFLLNNNEKNNQRKNTKNQMNLNTNLNSINSLSAQMRSKRDEEARMIKTIDNLNHKNDRLKEQHKLLKQKIEKDRNLTQINNLKNEIESLKSNLNDSQFNSDEMKINVDFMHDLIEILNSSIQAIDEECEQALRIKNGIEAEDETANFDNPNLKRSCESLKIKLARLQSQINENNNQREILIGALSNNQSSTEYEESDTNKKSDSTKYYDNENDSHNLNHLYSHKNATHLNKQKKIQAKPKSSNQKVKQKQTRIPTLQKNNSNNSYNSSSANNSANLSLNEIDLSLSNEDIRDAFVRLKMSSQVTACGNKHLLSLFEQMKILPNPIEQKSAASFLNKSDLGGLKKLSKNIEKLEENVKKVRQSSSFSSLYNMFFSMKSNTVRMREEIIEIGLKNKRLLNEISRLSLIQNKLTSRSNSSESDLDTGGGNLKRKSFDYYEQMKEKSRELLIRYFATQKTFSDDLDTAEKYKIEMQLDDIQEQYTTVMMEIDRIGDTRIQEKLHAKRKIKIRGRKEIPKLLEILEEASKFNLESEKKAVSLEKKVGATFSSLLNSLSQNKKNNSLDKRDDENDDKDYLYSHRSDNDEESVTKLAEVIIECRKVSEILSVIKERTNQFLNTIHKDNPIQVRDDEALKKLIDDVKGLLKKGGSAAQTKLQIVNLKRKIQYYSNMD